MIPLAVATALQFGVLIALAVVVLSLARQVGILHERLSPAGMRRSGSGIEPGQRLPELSLTAISGAPVRFAGTPSALLFVSADCPICRSVLPAFEQPPAGDPRRRFWVADGLPGTDGAHPDYAAYVADRGLDPDRFLISQTLGLTLGVRQIPALVLLDSDGRLVSRDTVSGPRELTRLLSNSADQPATPRGEKST